MVRVGNTGGNDLFTLVTHFRETFVEVFENRASSRREYCSAEQYSRLYFKTTISPHFANKSFLLYPSANPASKEIRAIRLRNNRVRKVGGR